MSKIFIILASLAVFAAHVARGEDAPKPVDVPKPADPETLLKATCTSDRGTFNTGDRYCASDSTSRVCSYGEWVDFQCDPGSSCLENKELKQVLCRKIVKNPESTQPQNSEPESKPSRARRDANDTAPAPGVVNAPEVPEKDTCESDRGTFKTGDRYCSSDTTSRVCAYGVWTDFQCDPDSKCLENKEQKQVLCRKVVKNTDSGTQPQDNGVAPLGALNAPEPSQTESKPSRARRDIDPRDKTCSSNRGTFRTGDRICASESVSRVCAYGQWYDQPCDPGAICLEEPRSKQVVCRRYVKNPRNRRDAPAVDAPVSEEKSCTSDQGTFQHGDSYCSSETTSRMCSYGQWYDNQCPTDFKCKENKALKQVLCRKIVRNAPWPTGPSGNDNAEPQPQQQPAPAQPQTQPNSNIQPQAQPTSNTQPETPAQPQAPSQPQAQPQSNPESPVPAAPAQEGEKTCAGNLKEGDQVCSGETGYNTCNDGQLLLRQCDPNAKCVASSAGNRVICREIRRNAETQTQQQSR